MNKERKGDTAAMRTGLRSEMGLAVMMSDEVNLRAARSDSGNGGGSGAKWQRWKRKQ
jgi:hypothetical protein